MSKCLVALLMFSVLAIPMMAADYQKASNQDTKQSQNQGNTTITVTDDHSSQIESQQRADKPQGWHRFVAWPEGVTAWAVLLTLVVLGIQTNEIRKSVRAVQNSIVLQFRPKLSIRAIKFDVSQTLKSKDAAAIWRLVLANVGSSIAYVHATTITFDSMVCDGDQETIYPLGTEQIDAFSLSPGEIKILSSEITNARDHLRVGKIYSDDPIVGQYVWVRCAGVFVFTDTIKIERRIGFRRRFDIKTGTLLPDSDSEYEFDDET
jgi:hypothetical protein